jgi:hypothetical protein
VCGYDLQAGDWLHKHRIIGSSYMLAPPPSSPDPADHMALVMARARSCSGPLYRAQMMGNLGLLRQVQCALYRCCSQCDSNLLGKRHRPPTTSPERILGALLVLSGNRFLSL